MTAQKIQAAAEALHQEVENMEGMEKEEAKELQNLLFRMKNHLGEPGPDPDAVGVLMAEVSQAIARFKEQHTKLSEGLSEIAEMFSSLGL